MRKKRLGEVLRERKHLSQEQLERALAEQQHTAMLLGELLLERRVIDKENLVSALEEVSKLRYVDVRSVAVDPEVLALIPKALAQKYCVLPLGCEGKHLVTAMAEPHNLRVLDELCFASGLEILPRLGLRLEILEAIERCYASSDEGAAQRFSFLNQTDISQMQFFASSSSERTKAAMLEFQADLRHERTPAVRLVSSMIAAAVAKKASDIHVEPQPTLTLVRVRVDGVLRELTQVPRQLASSLVSRIKILADLDISERRIPQDGRFLVQMGERRLDLRVSTLPTHDGEKVVIRLLDPAISRVSFTQLGLSQENAEALGNLLVQPQGMILVTGPTGSGKSTTLYAALNMLRSPKVNITTIEDPVEYKVEDINQVQVNPKAGLTFPGCLRSMLRQDPNIIMVGEIRDTETAEIALQAAQTGHLVLSTLHTNDAVSAITRLVDLNIPGFLIASSVTGILAQRLVRKLCDCQERIPMTPEFASRLVTAGIYEFDSSMASPVGCARCDNSGYKGRVGIYELLLCDDQVRALVRSGGQDEEIRTHARAAGMKLMQEDALAKVEAGITTWEEVLRVVPFEQTTVKTCTTCHAPRSTSFVFCPSCGSPHTGNSVRVHSGVPSVRHVPVGKVN